MEREAPPVKRVRVEEGVLGEQGKRERTAEGEREMGPEDQHPRDKETGDLIDTITLHRIPQAVTDDQIKAMVPKGYVKVVVMFREGQKWSGRRYDDGICPIQGVERGVGCSAAKVG